MDEIKNNREILMQHYTKPTNFGFLSEPGLYQQHLTSDSCADDLTLQIKVDANNQRFVNLAFEGSACVVATSSIDLWCSLLKGKTFAEALRLINCYEAMVKEGAVPDQSLAELQIFATIHHQKGRWTCALLGINGVKAFIATQ